MGYSEVPLKSIELTNGLFDLDAACEGPTQAKKECSKKIIENTALPKMN